MWVEQKNEMKSSLIYSLSTRLNLNWHYNFQINKCILLNNKESFISLLFTHYDECSTPSVCAHLNTQTGGIRYLVQTEHCFKFSIELPFDHKKCRLRGVTNEPTTEEERLPVDTILE